MTAASCASPDGSAQLPDKAVRSLAGTTELNLAAIDEPMLINLWATWCTPCKRELPDLQRVYDDPTTTVRIVGVNIGDDESSVREYTEKIGVTFEQFLDFDGTIETALRVSSLPATALIGADGEVITVHQGVLDEVGIRALIAQAG